MQFPETDCFQDIKMAYLCWFKMISESSSKEGKNIRKQYDYIDFHYCDKKCDGFNVKCDFYESHELSDIELEIIGDKDGI